MVCQGLGKNLQHRRSAFLRRHHHLKNHYTTNHCMTDYNELTPYKDAINQCVRCGACQAHCPVYDQARQEGAVARGKLALAKALLEESVTIDSRLEEDVSLCLMCGSCVVKCPNKVPTDKIVGAMRREISNRKGLSLTGKTVAALTGHPPLLKALVKTADVLSPVLFKKVPQTSGLRLRFPVSGHAQRTLPAVASKNLFTELPEFIQGRPDKPVVGLFAGCAITYIYPKIGVAMASLLNHLGYSVFTPRTQGCCGIPARSTGDTKLIEQLNRTNLEAFKAHEVAYIVTGCASCHSGIGETDPNSTEEQADFAGKVREIHQFLYQEGLADILAALPTTKERTRITYHDPCHLKTKGIINEPRALLQSLPNTHYEEMENSDLCCGLGGSFSAHHYAYSKAIGQRKVAGIKASKAELLATACPGCMLQLQDSINHAMLNVQTIHILELISKALALDQKWK